jgi:hypothetical protein
MDEQREQIKNIIEKLHNISKQPGKEWLLSELMVHFGNDAKITEIYEYCIENVLKNQAAEFYKDFPLRRIVPQLEKDFIRMETFRRQNKFEEFSMAVYQEIENITNELCRNDKLIDIVERLMGHPAYVKNIQNSDGSWTNEPALKDRTGNYQIAELLFGKSNANEKSKNSLLAHWAIDKVYCILYFVCYAGKMKSSDYDDFISYQELYDGIYQFRNLNHRNGKPSDSQKNIIETVNTNKSIYYFKFAEALLFYIEGVAKGLGKLDELHTYAMGEKKMDVKVVPKVVDKIDLSKIQTKRF